jgi:hypothetical protein
MNLEFWTGRGKGRNHPRRQKAALASRVIRHFRVDMTRWDSQAVLGMAKKKVVPLPFSESNQTRPP